MTCIHRTTLALGLLCLLSSGFDTGTRSRSTASAADSQEPFITISDTVKAGDEPVAEVKVRAEPGGYTAVTDDRGRYSIQVPYRWSGRLIPETADGPDSLGSFTNVTTDIIDGKRVPLSARPPTVPRSRAPAYPRAVVPPTAGDVFVIPTAPVAPQVIAETAEDLRIMLQIFRDKLSEPRLVRGAFVDFGDFFGDRDRTLEAFYLQGSAAVFVLEMDAPFSFAPPQPAGGAAAEDVDPVWQRVRQRLYAPQDPTPDAVARADETGRLDFQQFKEDLLLIFRHAANLRHVEPNEAVVLTILAHDDSAGWPAAPTSAGGSFSNRGGVWFEGSSYSTSSSSFGPGGGTTYADSAIRSSGAAADRGRPGRQSPGSAPATVLTIQVKKADIDAFAQGDLSFEQFQQRVKTFTY